MKTDFLLAAALSGLVSMTQAHMEMKYPAPLRSKFNEFTTNQDYDMTSPLSSKGGNFPCRGFHSLLGKPQAQSVVDWTAGGEYNLTIVGRAAHGGGSCQASLSYDGGKTFTAIKSWQGGCPQQGESHHDFIVPNDAPAGEVLFAWTWFNRIGNREMYMNCAVVTINPGCGSVKRDVAESFSNRPKMFVANVNKGCGTTEGTDLEFPNPGPDLDNESKKLSDPTGNCPS